jgi:hypothetical protein
MVIKFWCLNKFALIYQNKKRCKAKECGHGTQFNYNTGDCEPIQCLPGYELDSNNRCVGKKIS